MTDPERIEALIEGLDAICDRLKLVGLGRYVERIQETIAQLRADHPAEGERTPQDYTIESGGYLAERAVAFLRLMEEPDKGADNPDLQAEVYLALRSAVYEFRKRAARCAPDVHVAVSPEAVDEVIAQMPPPVDLPPDDPCVWAIIYEDAEVSPEIFTGCGATDAAHRTFNTVKTGYNCHLFVRVAIG